MSAFSALVLAVALTYAVGDFYRPYLPKAAALGLDLLVCFALFRASHTYLKHLKD